MPFFRSKHLQLLSSFIVFGVYCFVFIRMAALLSSTQPPTNQSHLINLRGSIRHASFIQLLPFGFTQDSSFAMEVQVTLQHVPLESAQELHLTNRTVFYVMLCNEPDWQTIKASTPSYCSTSSYTNNQLCTSFPLNNVTQVLDQTDQYSSHTTLQHTVNTRFFGRLIIQSCTLKLGLAEEDNKDIEMDVTAGLTMSNTINNQLIYVGFENEHQQLLVLVWFGLSSLVLLIWLILLCIHRKTTTKLQARMSGILVAKMLQNIFTYVYWVKRKRGDVWNSYKDEMVQLEGALHTMALAIMLECLLLVSVGWSITQHKLSMKSWRLVYGTVSIYFISVFIRIVSSSISSEPTIASIVEVISFLMYLVATFTTYYLIGFATTANIDALKEHLAVIQYVMRVEPKTTPSWSKLEMFYKFRLWVIVYVSVATLTRVVTLIMRGNDAHEKDDTYINAVGFLIEWVAVVALLWVFRPQTSVNVYFRQIPTVQIDATTTVNGNEEERTVPSIESVEVDTNPAVAQRLHLQRLQRMPTVTGVILDPYREQQPLPPGTLFFLCVVVVLVWFTVHVVVWFKHGCVSDASIVFCFFLFLSLF